MELGYALSSEEHRPRDLVRQAVAAEEAGFTFALVSDHYHPWTDTQGQSPFVWAVIGGIAQATERLQLGTGVTCPTVRIHPAVIAQAAATAAAMMPRRFFLGVGTGENLNEHILGDAWPPLDVRLEMLEEAVEVIRRLWEGDLVIHEGKHYRVHNARVYTLPEEPPPLHVAASGTKSARLAARAGDGLISVGPSEGAVEAYEEAGGKGPRFAQIHVCWAGDEATARRTAHQFWPNAAVPGQLTQELPLPAHFEQAAQRVSEEDVAATVLCGPDPDAYVAKLRDFETAGFDHVYLHQIGPDQTGFFDFYRRELAPRLG